MTAIDTMWHMTEKLTPQQLVGWVVRDRIINAGLTYSEASRRWPMSLPTLNRLMSTGVVGERFYRVAERNTGLPPRFLSYVHDGDVEKIRNVPGLAEDVREFVLSELGGSAPPSRKRSAR